MSPITRWKLACAALAATATVTTLSWHRSSAGHPRRYAPTVARAAGDPTPRRPIRVSASTLGLSEDRLIAQIRAARTGRQVAMYCEQLGVIGTDTSVEALAPMIDDRRAGVPEAITGVFGKIGTERAIALLVKLLDDDRPRVRQGAVYGLGSTGTPAARTALLALAADPVDPAQSAAIYALGQMGGDDAAEGLAALALDADYRTATSAIDALAQIGSEAAEAALIRLVDAPDPRVRAFALQYLPPTTDPALLTRLEALVTSAGDAATQAAAIGALARSRGPAALAVIAKAAREGSQQVRWAAVSALGEIGGDGATAVLTELLASSDANLQSTAAQALLAIGGPDARTALINAALAEDGDPSQVLYALTQLHGDDIDDVMRELAHGANPRSRMVALPQLVRAGDADAIALAVDLAAHGARNDRYGAMRALVDAGTPETAGALIELARTATGQSKNQAIDMALQVRPEDPGLTQLLVESLSTGGRNEASQAAWTLGRIGSDAARKALLAAATGTDPNLAQAAIGALAQNGTTAEVKATLLAVARDGAPQVKGQALQQLLQTGAPEAIGLAEQALAGKDPDVARTVLWGLASNTTADTARLIGKAAASGDPQIRGAAAQALANVGDTASTDALVGLAHDDDASVRSAAWSALGNIGSAKAVDTLLAATSSGPAEDRSSAMYALANLDDPRANEQLAKLINDPDDSVASSAIGASYNGGAAIDRALIAVVGNQQLDPSRRNQAAQQLRNRGIALDDATKAAIEALLGGDGGSGEGRTIRYGDWIE